MIDDELAQLANDIFDTLQAKALILNHTDLSNEDKFDIVMNGMSNFLAWFLINCGKTNENQESLLDKFVKNMKDILFPEYRLRHKEVKEHKNIKGLKKIHERPSKDALGSSKRD